mmetsp:Transcript_10162/g.30051  ORF Transcript_10162/g.30051 Transcript_10162/m.30051 type:complete len:138 (-) Transcript_10162:189-602(-)|eukprot:CAMPEP_0113552686 /NCGR_PEP_ID=MMETSP0015_2-20120614/15201_1 /TAXON_ID=2838 /ORGANISM="Odontella" /LENGTH=137 /DNA_ID=CAMNT_0000453683 /DNA_START=23 /DNA_END=436 /DNA_ORIENTATION=- /assembly_acc=CAM_ASM_000160
MKRILPLVGAMAIGLAAVLITTPVATAADCNGFCYNYNENEIEQCCQSVMGYEGTRNPEGIFVCMPYRDAPYMYSCTNLTLIDGDGAEYEGEDGNVKNNGDSEENDDNSSSSKINTVFPMIGFQITCLLCFIQVMAL